MSNPCPRGPYFHHSEKIEVGEMERSRQRFWLSRYRDDPCKTQTAADPKKVFGARQAREQKWRERKKKSWNTHTHARTDWLRMKCVTWPRHGGCFLCMARRVFPGRTYGKQTGNLIRYYCHAFSFFRGIFSSCVPAAWLQRHVFGAVFNLIAFTDFYAEFARPAICSFCGFRAGAQYKESPRSSNRMIVDLAPLRTLFPRSITFDCHRTKGGRLLILERVLSDWVRGGKRRRGLLFREDCITESETGRGEEKKKAVMWNIKVTWQSDIGFHIINLRKPLLCYSY